LAIDPAGKFVYVVNDDDNTISAYAIDATSGGLTPLAGSPVPVHRGSDALAIEAAGKFAYVSSVESDSIFAYAIDATTGALTPIAGSPFAPGTEPTCITFTRPP